MFKSALFASLALAAIAVAAPAGAAVVSVTSTVSGSAGAWVHDFTVTNGLPGSTQIYFFGVALPTGRNIAATPSGFDPNAWPLWTNTPYGGSATEYNNNWIDFSFSHIPGGASLGGFQALDTGTVAASNIAFFAYGVGDAYNGPDCFNCGNNPGFEGVVNGGTVPEPASWAMLIAGFGLTGAAMRRRRAVVA